MRCTTCDSELIAGARFCPNCGTPVAAASQPAAGFASKAGQRIDLPDPQVVTTGTGHTGVGYKIVGTTMQAALLDLAPGQTIFSESGGMAWMSNNIRYNTNLGGGLGGMFKRAISGESLFIIDYTAEGGPGMVAFAAEFPGKVIPLHLAAGQQVIAQKDAFMCAEKSVTVDIHFRRKIGAGLFGGEGFILQRITGPGVAFVEIDGEVVEYTLSQGQELKVDTGHVAMFEPTVQFDIEMVRGFRNILFGGEGLFLATLRGPGRVWLQTMPALNLARRLAQYMPAGSSSSSGSINIGNWLGGD